jgi:hypothetical protein
MAGGSPLLPPAGRLDRHIDFLGRLFLVWAAFNAIVGAAVLFFAAAAAILAREGETLRAGADIAGTLTAGAFLVVALAALVWAGVHAWCGRALIRHDRWGRLLGLALSVFNALLFPVGTALAFYGLWVLLQDDARARFEPA